MMIMDMDIMSSMTHLTEIMVTTVIMDMSQRMGTKVMTTAIMMTDTVMMTMKGTHTK
jgi:hypothetical protein